MRRLNSGEKTLLLIVICLLIIIWCYVWILIGSSVGHKQNTRYSSFHIICVEGSRYLVMESEKLRGDDTYGGITQMFEKTKDGLKPIMCTASDENVILDKKEKPNE